MKLTILGIPKPKQSFRYTRNGIRYQTKEVKQAEAGMRQQVIAQLPRGFIPWTGPVVVQNLKFTFPPRKSETKRNKALAEAGMLYKTTKPDLDNLQKILWDALKGVVFIDDPLVCCMRNVEKVYGPVPGIEIEIYEVPQI